MKNAAFLEFPELCLIIDANIAHKFKSPPEDDVRPVVIWLTKSGRKGQAVIGGKLRRELGRVSLMRQFLAILQRAGRLVDKDDESVDAETQKVQEQLEDLGMHHADDPHVIALARVSGARLLTSHDKRSGLHAMFKDRRLLNPPGKIYQNPKHSGLLRNAPRCKTCKA